MTGETDKITEPRNSPAPHARSCWLLAYFRQVYTHRIESTPTGNMLIPLTEEQVLAERLHLAVSGDGVIWTPLNDNLPTLPDVWLRDPFVARGPEGLFHLTATGGDGRRSILYARSPDLIAWETRSLPLMEHETDVVNCWAPEWVWDAAQQTYFVFWSSSAGPEGWSDSRLWYARTTDWQHFTPPRVLFDPDYTVIDGTLIPHDGTWYLFYKDERFGYRHGEHRFILCATSPDLEGPYTVATEALTPPLTEGPAVFPLPDGRFEMVFDFCMGNDYGAMLSDDLRHWRTLPDATFPVNARHGSVFPITQNELDTLRQRFPNAAV